MSNQSTQQTQALNSSVIKRTFFQKTVFLIYPNGSISLSKGECTSWFTENKEMWKKKEKKKAQPVKKVVMTKKEEY